MRELLKSIQPGDTIVTAGAGTFTCISKHQLIGEYRVEESVYANCAIFGECPSKYTSYKKSWQGWGSDGKTPSRNPDYDIVKVLRKGSKIAHGPHEHKDVLEAIAAGNPVEVDYGGGWFIAPDLLNANPLTNPHLKWRVLLLKTPPASGEYWAGQGGYYVCTLPALLGMPERHLVMGKDEIPQVTFGLREVTTACSDVDGRYNTGILMRFPGNEAAERASEYTCDGHADFFLPSRLDLMMAYICTPGLCRSKTRYWSSTTISESSVIVQDFWTGGSYYVDKVGKEYVRAFRYVPVEKD